MFTRATEYGVTDNALFEYALGLGDTALVLGQRMAEWLGKAPSMELDIAASNFSLDLVGQAQLFLEYAGEVEGEGRSDDDLSFLRDAMFFRNLLIVEQPNRDWGVTMVRHFLVSSFLVLQYEALASSKDERLAGIAAKALKEMQYHRRFSREWVVRLACGTDEGMKRITRGFDTLWRFTGEMFELADFEANLVNGGIAVDVRSLEAPWTTAVDDLLAECGIEKPTALQMITGRYLGHHTEHLGHILCDMQYMQRAYPGAKW
ncbi:1,2-phenylacetyl-CoA epoxidase subunit PaaC [Kordiimonas aquimaris]|uniref:1,2-phenylacetyl-CoA epoxidase subunit PaaC n=1 Tax=Kordiimonas aquimaris TaxID=707591 RepID=UPI0021D2CAA3|nr:1,2-phenylacetyl-CoA epoxidase subunit PaaC [Kordiimonas aquimaris]